MPDLFFGFNYRVNNNKVTYYKATSVTEAIRRSSFRIQKDDLMNVFFINLLYLYSVTAFVSALPTVLVSCNTLIQANRGEKR